MLIKKTNKNKFIFVSILLVALLSFIGFNYFSQNVYHDTPVSQVNSVAESMQIDNETYIVIHKRGCPDCEKRTIFVNQQINKLKKQHKKVLVIESTSYKNYLKQHKNTSNLFDIYNVVKVPTFLKLNHGNVVDQYSGTNKKEIKSVMEN